MQLKLFIRWNKPIDIYGQNPPTKFKDAVILHLANKYKSAKIKYIETGRKKFAFRYSENKKSKAI